MLAILLGTDYAHGTSLSQPERARSLREADCRYSCLLLTGSVSDLLRVGSMHISVASHDKSMLSVAPFHILYGFRKLGASIVYYSGPDLVAITLVRRLPG